MSEWKKYSEEKPLVGARYWVKPKNANLVTIDYGENIGENIEYFMKLEYPEPPDPYAKPCPICDSINIVCDIDLSENFYVECKNCDFIISLYKLHGKKLLIEKWNSIERKKP